MSEKLDKLKTLLAEAYDLEKASRLISWDEQTQMPPGGAEGRASMLATLARIQHARFTSDELGRLLEDLSSEMEGTDPDSDDYRLVQVTKRDFDLRHRQPESLIAELSRASSDGFVAWKRAQEARDYSQFAPFMKRNVELNHKVAEALGYKDRIYDPLFERSEPGMTTAQLEAIFSELKAIILPLVRQVAGRQGAVDASCLHQSFDEDTQLRFGLQIVQRFGYDLNRGRLDLAPHPFAASFNRGDVRITTRLRPNFLSGALFATMHESGHAMYEQGVDRSYEGTPLARGASPGVHESQSRLWENLVGRSRPFQDYLFPRLQETFPSQLGRVDKETFYKAINKVQPSLIRVEADEVTYNLHIMLRFELENEMLEGKADVDKLNKIWTERMESYFGIAPADDSEGVLQDIHWSHAGGFGGFCGYTLGNVINAQLFKKARASLPDLDGQLSEGEFGPLLGWLQTNLYRHGRKYTPNELVERITGQPIGTSAWAEYIQGKFSAIYGL
ncbi:MAG: carboxypeptidase M32 [Chloroflexia bacterium]